MMLEKITKIINGYLSPKGKLIKKYGTGNYVFFEERDFVYLFQKILNNKRLKGYKIFNEFPIEPLVPLKLTESYYKKLRENGSKYYNKIADNKYELKEEYLLDIEAFKEIRENRSQIKYERIFESKYVDLVIIDKQTYTKHDELIVPKVIFEFKFEMSQKRVNKDFRKGINLPKNSINAILDDMKSVYQLVKLRQAEYGYFVLIDEGKTFSERSEIANFINSNNLNTLKLNIKSNDFEGHILIIKIGNDDRK